MFLVVMGNTPCNYAYAIGSMYGIFTYIYHKNQLNVGKYTIYGSYGYARVLNLRMIQVDLDQSRSLEVIVEMAVPFRWYQPPNFCMWGWLWMVPSQGYHQPPFSLWHVKDTIWVHMSSLIWIKSHRQIYSFEYPGPSLKRTVRTRRAYIFEHQWFYVFRESVSFLRNFRIKVRGLAHL